MKIENKILEIARIMSLVVVLIAVIIVYVAHILSVPFELHVVAIGSIIILISITKYLIEDSDKATKQEHEISKLKEIIQEKAKQNESLDKSLWEVNQALQQEHEDFLSLVHLLDWMQLRPSHSHVNRQDLWEKITIMQNMIDNITAGLLQQDVHTFTHSGYIAIQVMDQVVRPPRPMEVMWSDLVQDYPSNDHLYVARGIYMYVYDRVTKRIEEKSKDLPQLKELKDEQEFNQTLQELTKGFKKYVMNIHILKPHNN